VSEHKGLISPVYISPHDRKAAADAAAAAAAKK
jgi:hypothetical protein